MNVTRTHEPILARAFSFGWYKRVEVGSKFFKLSYGGQLAVLNHEQGHLVGHHTELRMLCLLLAPFALKWLCHKQEMAADRYAAERGFSRDLIKLLAGEGGGGLYPTNAVRRAALEKYDQSRIAPVKSHSPVSA